MTSSITFDNYQDGGWLIFWFLCRSLEKPPETNSNVAWVRSGHVGMVAERVVRGLHVQRMPDCLRMVEDKRIEKSAGIVRFTEYFGDLRTILSPLILSFIQQKCKTIWLGH